MQLQHGAMNFIAVLILCLLTMVPNTLGINCVSCVGWSSSGCNDPYDESTSDNTPVPGNTYCLKVVYANYVERMAAGRSCTAGKGPGDSVRYCCSEEDYCNGITRSTMSFTDSIAITMGYYLLYSRFCRP